MTTIITAIVTAILEWLRKGATRMAENYALQKKAHEKIDQAVEEVQRAETEEQRREANRKLSRPF